MKEEVGDEHHKGITKGILSFNITWENTVEKRNCSQRRLYYLHACSTSMLVSQNAVLVVWRTHTTLTPRTSRLLLHLFHLRCLLRRVGQHEMWGAMGTLPVVTWMAPPWKNPEIPNTGVNSTQRCLLQEGPSIFDPFFWSDLINKNRF